MSTLDAFPECPELQRSYGTRKPRHVFIPYSWQPEGFPPAGSKALCGFVLDSEPREAVRPDHPDACVVCIDIAEFLG